MFEHLALFVSLLTLNEGLHTSQVELMQLYELQTKQFNAFNNYLELEMIRLEELKKTLAVINEWRDETITTKKTYLHSHIDAILLMSRLYDRLLEIEHLMKNTKSIETLSDAVVGSKNVSWEKVKLAIQEVGKLQRFYSIPISDMMAGRFNERIIGDPFDTCECFVILKCFYKNNEMYQVNNWAFETYKKWKDDGQPECVNIEELTFYMISSSLCTGFNFKPFFISNGLNYPKTAEKFVQYSSLMRNDYNETNVRRSLNAMYPHLKNSTSNEDYSKFRTMCYHGASLRGLTSGQCRYQTKNDYHRILMPFKEEDVSSDPFIKLYHDVLYDGEIVLIKSLAIEHMARSLGKNISTGNHLHDSRTKSGQYYWIEEEYAKEHLSLLNARIECLTGFSTKNAERYQIVNYGIGGPYRVPHIDPKRPTKIPSKDLMEFGNRIITVLFYLSDVENDGYTAFPSLNFNTPVEKGAALVMHNLNMSNGIIKRRARHGSCPILKGNKWVMARWLRESGQLLTYDWKKNSQKKEIIKSPDT